MLIVSILDEEKPASAYVLNTWLKWPILEVGR